jgi:metallopeptidase MepB
VAPSRFPRLLIGLFLAIFAIVALLQLSARAPPSVLQYLKAGNPFRTHFRPLTNSTMAPKQYMSPPQLPPKFTATKESILADTKRLIERSRGVQDSIVRDVKPENAAFASVLQPIALDDNKFAIESVCSRTKCMCDRN